MVWMPRLLVASVVAATLLSSIDAHGGTGEEMPMTDQSTVKVLNIFADEQGVSHFRDITFDMSSFVAGGTISAPLKTTELWFRAAPADQDSGWHTAPRRQLVITLSGGIAEFTTSDGDVRLVKPGEILLVEDTFGQGHKTRTVDNIPRTGFFIGLAD